jgi:molecular chaperone HscA
MSLLQIHEPGQTPLPHEDTAAIGIDLGTTYSVVAIASHGNAEVIEDGYGKRIIPSVVSYGEKVSVGEALENAENIASIKRLMGRGVEDVKTLQGQLPYTIANNQEGMVKLVIGKQEISPVEISAEILTHLKTQAEVALGKTVDKAVITVPAYFDDAARAVTKDAAKLAGLEVLRLINEPTAAALAYGLDNEAEGIYAIYDLGGGTFDISLLKLQKGVFQVLATGGNSALGGDDFDHALAEYAIKQMGVQLNQADIQASLQEARRVKEALSDNNEVTFSLVGKNITIAREAFESIAMPFVNHSIEACDQVLEDAGVSVADIHGVVMVGGSTRVPLVREKVAAFFNQIPLDNVNPDEVVALGAAIQAEALTKGSDNLLLDVIPLSLGIETLGGLVEKLIDRNTPIPTSVSQEFTTSQDGQTMLKIHVLQGEREMVDQNRSLAEFVLKGIPPMLAGTARIEVNFTVDADGLLTVSAQEKTTGNIQHIEVKPSYGLVLEEIETMLKTSMENAREDITQRLLIEARVEAERLMYDLNSAMESDNDLLKAEEKEAIESQLKRLEQACAGDNREEIDYAVQQLDVTARPFAERRMERSMASALRGKKIDNIAS